jgi:hypothetical protein
LEEGTPQKLGFLAFFGFGCFKNLGFLPFLDDETPKNLGFWPFVEYGSLKNLGFLPLEGEEACIFTGFWQFLAPSRKNGLSTAIFGKFAKIPGFWAFCLWAM